MKDSKTEIKYIRKLVYRIWVEKQVLTQSPIRHECEWSTIRVLVWSRDELKREQRLTKEKMD